MFFRNKLAFRITAVSIFFSVVATAVAFHIDTTVGLMVLGLTVTLNGLFMLGTYLRYRDIKHLSHYLEELTNGKRPLDIRNNEEGELSILKNQLYKLTVALFEQNYKMEEDKLFLSNTISDISHQLKTPLTSMSIMLDLLEADHLPKEKRQAFIKNINSQLNRLDWLTASLLKMAKLDADTIIFKKESANVKLLLEKALNPIKMLMELKQINLNIEVTDEAVLVCDYYWTSEALTNILKNAVEYTPEGKSIAIKFISNPIFKGISIEDQGKGMEPEELKNVFKRFYRGENAGNDNVGIGLALAHSIIKKQNGDIALTSEKGVGSIFTIKFYQSV